MVCGNRLEVRPLFKCVEHIRAFLSCSGHLMETGLGLVVHTSLLLQVFDCFPAIFVVKYISTIGASLAQSVALLYACQFRPVIITMLEEADLRH